MKGGKFMQTFEKLIKITKRKGHDDVGGGVFWPSAAGRGNWAMSWLCCYQSSFRKEKKKDDDGKYLIYASFCMTCWAFVDFFFLCFPESNFTSTGRKNKITGNFFFPPFWSFQSGILEWLWGLKPSQLRMLWFGRNHECVSRCTSPHYSFSNSSTVFHLLTLDT